MTSPVRLGVSPAAAWPTPTGVVTQRFEALFRPAGALGYTVCFTPGRLSGLSMCECGATGSATHRSACPVLCHSESRPSQFICVRIWDRRVWSWSDCLPRLSHTPPVSVPPRERESSLPRLPISAPPTGLDECLFFISLGSDFLAIRFSVSFGCARRRSVSTYTAILVP